MASLVAESEKSVMRALTRVTPEFTTTRVDIEPNSNEGWVLYLEQGEVVEYRPANRSGMAAFSISVIGPDGSKSGPYLYRTSSQMLLREQRAAQEGNYYFRFENVKSEKIWVDLAYRRLPKGTPLA